MICICRYPGFVLPGTRVLALLAVHVLRRGARLEEVTEIGREALVEIWGDG